jgi:hypothetical protein
VGLPPEYVEISLAEDVPLDVGSDPLEDPVVKGLHGRDQRVLGLYDFAVHPAVPGSVKA